MKNDFFRIHALFTRTTNQSPCLHEILATGGVYGLDKGEEKMKLIKNIDVYAPEPLGKKDVLILGDKIAKIEEAGGMPEIPFLLPEDVIDGSDRILTPGFIDCHVHVLGGGGEGGFANRTPEATVEGMTRFGVTTVVGCLGTDVIGRDMCALVARTKGLNERGMSAYC